MEWGAKLLGGKWMKLLYFGYKATCIGYQDVSAFLARPVGVFFPVDWQWVRELRHRQWTCDFSQHLLVTERAHQASQPACIE